MNGLNAALKFYFNEICSFDTGEEAYVGIPNIHSMTRRFEQGPFLDENMWA